MKDLTEGRIVHFVLNSGEHRPAIIVNTIGPSGLLRGEGTVNTIVFLDGPNDASTDIMRAHLDTALLTWRASVHYSEAKEPGTWHWIEKAKGN